MHFGAALKSFIYLVSCSLLYPVLFLLSFLTIWLLLVIGACIAEWIARYRLKQPPQEQLASLVSAKEYNGIFSYPVLRYCEALNPLLLSNSRHGLAGIENLLQRHSLQLHKSLDRLSMVVKIGPGLGLIGTLIPMGTGLAALGQGDITKLSSDLVIAFTTTVVGMMLGLVAYFLHTIRRRWVQQDCRHMEFVTEVLTSDNPDTPEPQS